MKGAKEESYRLEDDIRRLHKEKSEDKDQYLRMSEERIRMQGEKLDLETRLQSLIKDNQTLEINLKDLQRPSSNVQQ